MDGQITQRVVAAVEHARMLLYRGATAAEIESELTQMSQLNPKHTVEAEFATAIEMLAQAPDEDVVRWARAVEQHHGRRGIA